jgi:hypothetical protein
LTKVTESEFLIVLVPADTELGVPKLSPPKTALPLLTVMKVLPAVDVSRNQTELPPLTEMAAFPAVERE